MIIVKLMGGLGNQMFQYATALSVAKRNRSQLLVDKTSFDNMHPNDTPRTYDLGVFNISAKIASDSDLSKIRESDEQYGIKDKIKRRLVKSGPLWKIVEPNASYYSYIERAPNNSYLVGWWQNEKYFKEFRSSILKEFSPKNPLTDYTQKILEQIKSSPTTVSLHVRRSDYVINKHANLFHGLASVEYYKNAIDYFTSRFDSPLFVVVSDDIKWCKSSLTMPANCIFVEPQKNRHDYEDMMIMKACDHAVIANSSFSWWGAWLSENPSQIVIAPSVWFQDEKANSETEIVPSSWKRL